jgi:GcrA cell cycle regulator
MSRPSWSPDDAAALARLWPNTTLSVRQIAERIGHTRGAVHGMAARMRLPQRGRARHPIAGITVSRSVDLVPLCLEAESLEGAARAIRELGRHECRWPIGDPLHDDFRFCRAPVGCGQSYCAEHARKAWRVGG